MIKDNQPNLFAALNRLDWPAVPIGHASDGRGHARFENRTIQIMPTPDGLPFPHIRSSSPNAESLTCTASRCPMLALYSPSPALTPTAPARPTWPDSSADTEESKALHWTGETLYREDHSTARTRSGPRRHGPRSATSPSAR